MNVLAFGITMAALALQAPRDGTNSAYRTRGAVSARPQCGYTDEPLNLLPQSMRFPVGTWSTAASQPNLAPIVDPKAELGPSGERDAARVTFDAGGAPTPERWSCLETTASVVPGETYTFSFSVKGPNGAFLAARGVAGAGFSRIPLDGTWQRVHLTEIAADKPPMVRIGLGAHDPGEAAVPARITVLLWGPQLILGRGTIPYRASGEVPLPAWPLVLVAPEEIRTACPPVDAPQPAATNLLRWTGDPTRTPWIVTGLTGAHAGQGPSPIGTHDAHLLQEAKAPGPHGLSQTFPCPGAGMFVASVFVQPGTCTAAELTLALPGGERTARFDLGSGTGAATGGGVAARVDAIGKGWLRIQATARATGPGRGTLGVRLLDRIDGSSDYEGNGSAGLLFWGPQVEAGDVATSYIPTFFIPETREADEPLAAPSR